MVGHALPWFRWIEVSTTQADHWIAGTAPSTRTRTDQPTIWKNVRLAHMPLICKSTFAVKTSLHLNHQRECPPIDSCIFRPPRQFGQRTLKNKAGCSQMHDWKDSIIFLSTLQIISDPAIFSAKIANLYKYWISTESIMSRKKLSVCVKKSTFSLTDYLR